MNSPVLTSRELIYLVRGFGWDIGSSVAPRSDEVLTGERTCPENGLSYVSSLMNFLKLLERNQHIIGA
jgi:hypothetical protein